CPGGAGFALVALCRSRPPRSLSPRMSDPMKTRLSAWLAALAATLPLNAQSPLPPALPDDTLVLVSFPDLRASLQEFQQMPLAKMWREPEVQDFFADALKMVEEHWEQGMAEV